jgi:hypothetical protein
MSITSCTTCQQSMWNIEHEHRAIQELVAQRGQYRNGYEEGRQLLLAYILGKQPNTDALKRAGYLLYNCSGYEGGMQDPLVWEFIPKCYRNKISLHWNGIGGWSHN